MKKMAFEQPLKIVAAAGVATVLLFATVVLHAQSFQVLETTIGDVHASLRSGEITCRGLVELYLDRIEAYNKQGPELNAIQHLNARALEEADELDVTFDASGPVGPLHCVPVLLKDQSKRATCRPPTAPRDSQASSLDGMPPS